MLGKYQQLGQRIKVSRMTFSSNERKAAQRGSHVIPGVRGRGGPSLLGALGQHVPLWHIYILMHHHKLRFHWPYHHALWNYKNKLPFRFPKKTQVFDKKVVSWFDGCIKICVIRKTAINREMFIQKYNLWLLLKESSNFTSWSALIYDSPLIFGW